MLSIFRKKNRNSKSDRSNTGYKGITKRKDNEKYQAQVSITKLNKQYSIYSERFKTLKEAIKAREEYIDKLY